MADRMLTREEWLEVPAGFVWLEVDYPSWGEIHYEICTKWIIEHAEGWAYLYGKFFVFELDSDKTLFRLWLEEGLLERESGGVKKKEEQ